MTGKLVSIALAIDTVNVLGYLFFDDDQHPHSRQINIVTAENPPGYTVQVAGSQTHWEGSDPYLREADRIVRTILDPPRGRPDDVVTAGVADRQSAAVESLIQPRPAHPAGPEETTGAAACILRTDENAEAPADHERSTGRPEGS